MLYSAVSRPPLFLYTGIPSSSWVGVGSWSGTKREYSTYWLIKQQVFNGN